MVDLRIDLISADIKSQANAVYTNRKIENINYFLKAYKLKYYSKIKKKNILLLITWTI